MSLAMLKGFQSIRPNHEGDQDEFLDWLAEAHAVAVKDREGEEFDLEATRRRMGRLLKRYGCDSTKISRRGTAIGDFEERDWKKMRIFNVLDHPKGAPTSDRTEFYGEVVNEVFRQFYPSDALPPRDLIHATCTGYLSPSGAQNLVEERDWGDVTRVTHAYHMGCYSSVPAIRLGMGFLAMEPGRNHHVGVVHTELCSLQLDPFAEDPEQIVVQGLFGDGFVKYDVAPTTETDSLEEPRLEILAVREEIIPKTREAMSWSVGDHGMVIGLAGAVPNLIGEVIENFLRRLYSDARCVYHEGLPESTIALHPGGPKIIDRVQEILSLSQEQLQHTRGVLFDFGNMSSATLPHIWERILLDSTIPNGTLIPSVAFGPGLTIAGVLLRKVSR